MTRVRKPCPACGEVDRSRSANEICHACKTLLAEAKAIMAAWDRDLKRRGGFLYWIFSATDHWNAGYHGLGLGRDETQDELIAAFTNAVQQVSAAVPTVPGSWSGTRAVGHDGHRENVQGQTEGYLQLDPDGRRHSNDSIYAERVRLTELQAHALRRLDNAIRAAIVSAHLAGKTAGENFVAGLARGDLSMNDYTDRVVEEAAEAAAADKKRRRRRK